MNHGKVYAGIIQSAKSKESERLIEKSKGSDFEKHHIMPHCMGGDDSKDNVVLLTTREHFIAHYLLYKSSKGSEYHDKLVYAFNAMRTDKYGTRYINSRLYNKFKSEFSKIHSQQMTGEGNPMYGKPCSEERRKKIGDANRGKKPSAETKQKISAATLGKKKSKETRKKMREANLGEKNSMYGKTHTPEARQKIRETHLGKKKKRRICEHCNKDVAVNTYPQWHGDKCKQNPANKQKRIP